MGSRARSSIMVRSSRAKKGSLSVVKMHCPRCGHNKALETQNLSKCSKCGYEHSRAEVWIGDIRRDRP